MFDAKLQVGANLMVPLSARRLLFEAVEELFDAIRDYLDPTVHLATDSPLLTASVLLAPPQLAPLAPLGERGWG